MSIKQNSFVLAMRSEDRSSFQLCQEGLTVTSVSHWG